MPSRTRSAEGIPRYRSSHTGHNRRSRTEETIRRSGPKTHVGILKQARSKLPTHRINNSVITTRVLNGHYNNGTHAYGHKQKAGNGRPGTATLSSRPDHRKSHAAEATRRAMQWNASVAHDASRAHTPAPPPPPPLPKPEIDEETSLYKPVDPKVAKLYEDRAYHFYERQKELELKRELMERAAKRPPGAESVIKNSNGNIVNGRSVYGKLIISTATSKNTQRPYLMEC